MDFIKPDFSLRTVTVEMNGGVVAGLSVRYTNGLLAAAGTSGGDRRVTLTVRPEDGEKIIACSIETGCSKNEADAKTRVTAIRLHTNRGNDLYGQPESWKAAVNSEGVRGSTTFKALTMHHFDPLLDELDDARLKGFCGFGVTTSTMTYQSGIYRLAPIWGNKEVGYFPASGRPCHRRPSHCRHESELFQYNCSKDENWAAAPGHYSVSSHDFAKIRPIAPTVITGFTKLDVGSVDALRVAVSTPTVTEAGFKLSLKSHLSMTYDLSANALVLPNGRFPFQHGYVDAGQSIGGRRREQNATVSVIFSQAFTEDPTCCVWFTEISQPNTPRNLKATVQNISRLGMTIMIESWVANHQFEGAQVGWLAWPAKHKAIKAGNEYFTRGQQPWEMKWPGDPFSKDPKIFCAFNYIDFANPADAVRARVFYESATKEKVKWTAGTWEDTVMDRLGFCWIAIE
ncbi:hypothetical protein B0T24DRAFT_594372 [Lasiosphaeria ovina]|uniref:H-type lectin domain-containing protein n=1 Tax=Lasiosphaeria ovina TaxID=92902 RepID=A0AAE0KDQ2_9PEZI|nr:hypothetical protein B0T24DRAFT_594372 [Lasiosphaeria ovina]